MITIGTLPAGNKYLRVLCTPFLKPLSTFGLGSDVTVSGPGTLNFVFTAASGHNLQVNDNVIFLDQSNDTLFHAVIIDVSGNDITIDRPFDYGFTLNNAMCAKVAGNMAVSPTGGYDIFTVRRYNSIFYVDKITICILASTTISASAFGDLPALNKGVIFRRTGGINETIYTFNNNSGLQLASDYLVNIDDYGYSAEFYFYSRGGDKTPIILAPGDRLQFVIQDDLSGLIGFFAVAKGHVE